jgi:hypothetical protein
MGGFRTEETSVSSVPDANTVSYPTDVMARNRGPSRRA